MRTYFLLFISLFFFSAAPAQAEEANLTKAQIEQLNKNLVTLSQKAQTAKGEPLSILQLEIYNTNKQLRKAMELAMKAKNRDDAYLTKQIQELVKYNDIYISYVAEQLEKQQTELEASTEEERLLLQIPLNGMRVAQSEAYREQYENYTWLKTLNINVDEGLANLKVQIQELSQYTTASLSYAERQVELLKKQLASLPADQQGKLNLKISYLQRNVTAYTAVLQNLVDIAEALSIDTMALKRELFSATGNITHDFFSWEMIKSSLSSGISDVTAWFVNNSANLLFNVFLFFVIMVLAHFIKKFIQKILTKALKAPHLKLSNLMQQFLVTMSGRVIFCIALLVALAQVGLNLTPVIAGLGMAGIIIGFALQDTLSNFASGMMLLIYRPFDEDDWVQVAGLEGVVKHVSLVNTTVRTFDNEVLLIPNSKIWSDVIINRTFEKVRRVDMVFGVSYSDSIPKVEKILHEIIAADPRILRSPEPMIKLDALADSSINFIVRPWVRTDDYMDVKRDCTREVKMRFDAEGINIPFPQRDVHLHLVNDDAKIRIETNKDA